MTNVCITIDTEGDSANNPHSTFFGIEIMLPKLLTLFAKYDIKATFFVQEDEICQVGSLYTNLLKSLEYHGHEIGCQAHGLIGASGEKQEYLLTNGIQKLKQLGFNPTSFRAGRKHFNSSILRMLEKNHIKYDSSVVPGLRECFSDGTVRCDHIGSPHESYFPSYENHRKRGNSTILELPINRYPKLPPDRWAGMLTGTEQNDEILFDYFYVIRKDKLILIGQHAWDGLSWITKRFVRDERYRKVRRFIFQLLTEIVNPKLLINSNYLNRFERFLKYVSQKNAVHFATIKEAGQSLIRCES